jgi:protein-export membrane protein SecD
MRTETLHNWIRFGALAAVTLLSVAFFWPREADRNRNQLLHINLGLDLRGGCMLTLQLEIPPDRTAEQRQQLLDQTLVVINNRVNALGLTEPIISPVGADRVLIQLPGADTAQMCEEIAGIRGVLEFKMALKDSSLEGELKPESRRQEVLPSRECFIERERDKCRYYLIETEVLVGGEDLDPGKAKMLTDTSTRLSGSPFIVEMTFTESGARKFAQALVKVGPRDAPSPKQLAIVLDGQVQSAPYVEPNLYRDAKNRGIIRQATITGQFTIDEAKLLAAVLNAGALPTTTMPIQKAVVGPSLGQDSIDKGFLATLIAGALILGFMVFYYRLSGIIADFTMVLNIVVLLGVLAALNATLTLPGIAGIILTIGMGVDSNVLIFERMREELKTGKPARAAIDAGYNRALTTIIDSHVTTLITALILFVFGTGAIRGFAITLCLGISINLFTALVGTRMAFEFLKLRRIQRLSI